MIKVYCIKFSKTNDFKCVTTTHTYIHERERCGQNRNPVCRTNQGYRDRKEATLNGAPGL